MSIIKSKKHLSGVHAAHLKKSKDIGTVAIDVPDKVTIPMLQHLGAPCEPTVKKGDTVTVGQKIGESEAAFSAPIHASCSGVVSDIVDYAMSGGGYCKAVVIETDKQQTMDPSIRKPEVSTREEFIAAIRESGLVGLGGAGFPTHVKLAYKDIDRVKKLVINAAECEPYITSDYRECLENTDNIVSGVRLVKKYLDIDEVYIGIEDNKPQAMDVLDKAFEPADHVTVIRLKTIYPQGAEKSIIYATTGVTVGRGQLPADCGVIVLNVSTVGFIGKYMSDGIPLISKRLTVDGDFVDHPANVQVPIGTPIRSLLDYCKIEEEKCGKVLMGGPMMGIPVTTVDTPIIKNNNAVIVLSPKASVLPETTACIRCGKCIAVCPVRLMPAKLERAYDTRNTVLLQELAVDLCINCGCCSYICPAKRHLAQKNQLAKDLLKKRPKESAKNE